LFDFVTKRKWFFLVSGVVILIGIISLIVSGLNLGIEFSSGSTLTLVFEEPVGQADLTDELTALGHSKAVIQHSPKEAFKVQGLTVSPDPKKRQQELDKLAEDLQSKFDTTVRVAEFGVESETVTSGNTTAEVGKASLALIFGDTIGKDDLSSGLGELGYSDFSIELTTVDSYLVRTETIYQEEEGQIRLALEERFGPLATLDTYSISPVVAAERVRYTVYAVIVAAIGILLYITWAFRKLIHPISYGVCAIVALVHDALIVLGVFSLFRVEVNSMFIIAILTVIGYSVNNTIVIFDRIRETRRRDMGADFAPVVNVSINETLARSLNTSVTTLLVLLALALFGGPTIFNFVLALIIGVVVGTYSSLFIASQLLVSWEKGELKRLYRWIPLRRFQG